MADSLMSTGNINMNTNTIYLFLSFFRYGSTVYSPLLNGILTGKYNNGFPKDSRLQTYIDFPFLGAFVKLYIETYFGEANKEKYITMLTGLGEIAKELGCSQAQLAMAWVLKNKDVSTAITSASKPEQLEEIVGSLKFVSKITAEVEEKMNKLTGTRPAADTDFRTFSPGT